MKRLIVATMLFASVTALAGKEERDLMTKEVQPAVHEAEAKWKSACGCTLAVTVDGSINKKDDLYNAKHFAEEISENVGGYCTDKESRAAMCKLKTVSVRKGAEAAFAFKGGAGTAIVDNSAIPSWDMITREVDR